MSSSFKAPAEAAKAVAATGGIKNNSPIVNLILLSFLAGAYIAFGGLLAEITNAGMLAAVSLLDYLNSHLVQCSLLD